MKKTMLIITALLLVILSGCGVPSNVYITKEVPSEVILGEEFNFTITVHNENSKTHELRSIDIGHSFLEGIMILDTNYVVKQEYNIIGERVFEFKKDLPGETETEIIFSAKAINPGAFSGDLDVCINRDHSCIFSSIRILVE